MTMRPRARWLVAGAGFAYAVLLRPRLLTWGATPAESAGLLPGDDLVRARWQTTRAITVAAPPEDVWPWLVQMGFGRAGWYSYDRLERAIGIGDFAEGGSARSVLPQFQSLATGDTVPLGPDGGLTVAVVDRPRALVLRMTMSALTGAPAQDGDRAVLDWTGLDVGVRPRTRRGVVVPAARPGARGLSPPGTGAAHPDAAGAGAPAHGTSHAARYPPARRQLRRQRRGSPLVGGTEVPILGAQRPWRPLSAALPSDHRQIEGAAVQARDVMTRDVISVGPGSFVKQAAEMMSERGFAANPRSTRCRRCSSGSTAGRSKS